MTDKNWTSQTDEITTTQAVVDTFELPVPELLTSPSPTDLAGHFKDLGIEEPRAYYGPVSVGMVH